MLWQGYVTYYFSYKMVLKLTKFCMVAEQSGILDGKPYLEIRTLVAKTSNKILSKVLLCDVPL